MIATDLSIAALNLVAGTQSREQISEPTVVAYAEDAKTGDAFPPIDVFSDGTSYWVVDGFHRVEAYKRVDRKTIEAAVHKGTLRDAKLFSLGCNGQHGLRRTNRDKRMAVMTMLNDEEWVTWSDGKIADQCGVSQQFAREVRSQLTTDVSSLAAKTASKPRVGRDGKKRKPRKTKPAKSSPAPRPAKNGAAKPNAAALFTAIEKAIGQAIRGLDDVARVRGGQGPKHKACLSAAGELLADIKSYRKGGQ